MDYINEKALEDNDSSLKFALLFSSRFFDSLAMNSLKVRSKMMSLLEMNYQNATQYLREDKTRLYNSITLLGECFHRIRTSQNDPIEILGKSLLNLLIQTIKENDYIDQTLARVILSQITLNGSNMKLYHKDDTDELLFHVRRNLIEQNDLTDTAKALLLMTLDLHNNNISNLSKKLVEMYTEYLKRADADNPTNNLIPETNDQSPVTVQKKWSEQVGEELYNNNGFRVDDEDNSNCPTNYSPREQYWRQPRYNCSETSQEENNSRRQSIHLEEDGHSVRSEGGSLRIYNARDKFRNGQRNNSNNNNWENKPKFHQTRRSYRVDDSRKDIGNYPEENRNPKLINADNSNKRNSKYYRPNNYERPPRFRQKDFENTWRDNSSRSSSQTRQSYRDLSERNENFDSLPSPRTRTLQRNIRRNDNCGRRSISPSTVSERDFRPQPSRNFSSTRNSQNGGNRYSSQSSLTNDYPTWDRRTSNNFRRNENSRQNELWNRKNPDSNSHNITNTNDEILKHARETSKYLETLSQR